MSAGARRGYRLQAGVALRPLAIASGLVLLSAASLTNARAGEGTGADTDPAPPPPVSSAPVRTVQVKSTKLTETDEAKEKLAEVSGGTNLITAEDLESHRAATAADLLSFQPGVFVSSAGGQDAIKLSIRGSAINRGTGYFRTGVYFTFDELPVTGPSGTPYELLEPLGLQYTEILRGGNAFDTGALALGGSINYVTQTGRDNPGETLRFEIGSWAYRKGQASVAGQDGAFDFYLSAISSSRAGFQAHSDSRADRIIANFGYQISDAVDTRFFFRYGYTDFSVPGQILKSQVEFDPSLANSHAYANDSRRVQPGSEFVGNITKVKLDPSSDLDIGLLFHNFPISIEGSGTSANTTNSEWTYGNIAEHLIYNRTDTLFGDASLSKIAFFNSTDIYGSVSRYGEAPGLHSYGPTLTLPQGGLITTNHFDGSSDRVLLATNQLEVSPNLGLTTGLGWTETERDIDINAGAGPSFKGPSYSAKTRDNIAPKLGLRYDIAPLAQLYANVSKGVEPRNDWDGVITPQNGVPVYKVLDVNDQSAWMEEVGGRGAYSVFKGSVSYYRSEVRNEILTVTDPVLGVTTEENAASPTTHQGVEVGLETLLWEDGNLLPAWTADSDRPSDSGRGPERVVWRQAYTWSDFFFNNDPTFHHNTLPGIPPHYYQGEIEYQHPTGFFVNFNTQAASGYYIDYANTFRASGYAIVGARLGYNQPGDKGLSTSLDFRNLANRHYATDISSPVTNAKGTDQAVFDPGDGFGIFATVEYKF